jgi:hypothetical protein
VKFRVVVEMADADKFERSIVPKIAFAQASRREFGRPVMQAGAFGDSTKASQLMSSLTVKKTFERQTEISNSSPNGATAPSWLHVPDTLGKISFVVYMMYPNTMDFRNPRTI